ncbi:tensin-4-like isoform X1 [Oncorhynchus tshawytscha]|uniref:SH2 domain-containing protein n=1 Tax=Oncorhynchus tshawytscha TaxID=74940 RepID=A0AAZ3S0X1_ONCTS|nr:tensin-4-like isoform X1 [Oncorhynchus tshawytscha]
MPIAGAMSHIIPNHILRVGQSTCLDSAREAALGCSPSAMMDPNGSCSEQDDLDISLDNLNQLILELDPTFDPIYFNKRSQSSSLHTAPTSSGVLPLSSPDDFSPDEDVSSCVARGCAPRHISTSVSPSCSIPIPLSSASGSRCSPQGSLVFSDASSRPPLPCGSVVRRRLPSTQGGEAGTCSSPVTLRMSHSHRNSAVSMISTSPGSETSYMMGSYQSLLSDSEGDSPESLLLYRTSSSYSDVSRSSTRPFTNKRSPTGPSPLGHFQGIHSSPASLAGSLTDIPVVLVNGAPERELSPQSPPEAMVPDIQIKQRPSFRPSSPSPSHSLQGHFQGNQHSMKFVMDTSQFWFRPHINRVQAEALVIDKEPGTFVVRDSTSFRGSFGLAMKVDQAPVNISPTGQPAEGSSDLVRHFLIESSAKGVRIKGSSHEPYFGSLSALVFQHTVTPYALPCKLLLQSHDLNKGQEETNDRSAPEDKTKTACNFLYLSAIPTETLTGPCAVQKAVSSTFTMDLSTITPTIVNLKVSPKGVTLTDIQRKLFFRRHYPAHMLSYSGEDPDKRLWHKSSKPARIFGIVAKGTEAGRENVCHVFAEYDPLQPCNPTIELTQGIIFKP